MKKIKLSWLDIVITSLIGLSLIFLFIPLNPSIVEGDQAWYSLFSYVIKATMNGGWYFLLLFILFVLISLAAVVLVIFKKPFFYKLSLLVAAGIMMFLDRSDWPTMLFSTIIAVVYLVILLTILVIDGFKNRREISELAQEEKNKDEQDSSN